MPPSPGDHVSPRASPSSKQGLLKTWWERKGGEDPKPPAAICEKKGPPGRQLGMGGVLAGAGGCVWHWGGPRLLQHTAVKQNHAGWTRCPTLPARLQFLEAAARSGGIDALPLAENAEHFAGFHREALQEKGSKATEVKAMQRDPQRANLRTPLQLQVPTTKACKEKPLPPEKAIWKYSFWISTNQLASAFPCSGLLTCMKMLRHQPLWGHNSYKMPERNDEGGLLQHSLQLSPKQSGGKKAGALRADNRALERVPATHSEWAVASVLLL